MIDEKHVKTVRGNVLYLYEVLYKSWGKHDVCGIWADCAITAHQAFSSLQAYDENMRALSKHTAPNVLGTGYVHGITFSNAMETQNGTLMPICVDLIHNMRIIPDVYQITDILDTGKVTGSRI